MVSISVEWWHSGQDNVGDDTNGPQIAFLVIFLVQDLWGDVVWGSKLLIKWLVLVEYERGTEIDDLDLIEVFVLFKENILWLQISVDDFLLMAVVDARKNLLNQNSAVLLCKLASGNDFIEKLSSFADSKN